MKAYITRNQQILIWETSQENFAERHSGISLACLVAADRYEHISAEILPELNKGKIVITDRYILSSLILQWAEILPELNKGKIVITDRYILSSLILQCMDNVKNTVILGLNSEIVKPNLQIAVSANEDILQKRLSERKSLTRFEKGNQSHNELYYMEKGVKELQREGIDVLMINNNDNLEENVQKIVSYIVANWRTK